jgi:hypothetical protein
MVASALGRGTHAALEARLERGWAYAKVEQVDGEMAWSSPLWVEPSRPRDPGHDR